MTKCSLKLNVFFCKIVLIELIKDILVAIQIFQEKYIFFTLFLCSIVFGTHQPVKFQHYTIDDGLSHNWAHAVCQDSRGFIWIAT